GSNWRTRAAAASSSPWRIRCRKCSKGLWLDMGILPLGASAPQSRADESRAAYRKRARPAKGFPRSPVGPEIVGPSSPWRPGVDTLPRRCGCGAARGGRRREGPASEEAMSQAYDPYAALRHRDYRLLLSGGVLASLGAEIQAVAVGWELYRRTHSAAVLGL